MTFAPIICFICAKNGMNFAPISDMTLNGPNRYRSGFKIREKFSKTNGNLLKYSGGFSVHHLR